MSGSTMGGGLGGLNLGSLGSMLGGYGGGWGGPQQQQGTPQPGAPGAGGGPLAQQPMLRAGGPSNEMQPGMGGPYMPSPYNALAMLLSRNQVPQPQPGGGGFQPYPRTWNGPSPQAAGFGQQVAPQQQSPPMMANAMQARMAGSGMQGSTPSAGGGYPMGGMVTPPGSYGGMMMGNPFMRSQSLYRGM